jgi:hypothetical protein
MSRSQDLNPDVPGSETAAQTRRWEFGFLIRDLRHGFRRNGPNLSRRAALSLLLGMALVWLLAGAYLVLVSQTMIAARRVQDMRDHLLQMHRENADLEQEVAKRLVVDRLLGEVEGDGYAPATRIEYVEP